MTNKFSFIHTADIHLGSILTPKGEPESLKIKKMHREAVYNSFNRICLAAIRYKVKFILLAGDTYDADYRSVRTNHFFVQKCQELAEKNISVYIIGGNHDPFQKGQELFQLPGNVFYFDSEELQTKEVYGENGELLARILGLSYRGKADSRKMYNSYTPPDGSVVNIGLLHTQLDLANKNYVPCSLDNLMSKQGIDYWALGHIHKWQIINRQNPVVAYPGIPQGRDFGEEGVGGCFLVEFDTNKRVSLSFIPTSSLIWSNVELVIDSDPENIPENIEELKNRLIISGEKLLSDRIKMPEIDVPADYIFDDHFDGYIVRWVITGRGEIHRKITEDEEVKEYLIAELNKYFGSYRPFIYTDSIAIRTRSNIPKLAQLIKEPGIAKEINEIIQDPEFKDSVQGEFGNIWEVKSDHEDINEEKFQLDDMTYERIIQEATDLIIEHMLAKEEG